MIKRLLLTAMLAAPLALAIPTFAQEHDSAPAVEKRVSEAAPGHVEKTVHEEPTGEGHEAQEGLLDIHPDRMIWTIGIFAIMLIILYPTAWKNVLAGLKAREAKIRGDISSAEAARAKAEATLKEYNVKLAEAETKVRDMIAKAVTDAEAAAAQVRARSQAEAEEAKEKAIKEIEGAKNAALREVYDQTALLATNVAEKILRRNLNADDQRDLVARSLEQMQSVNKN